MGLLNNVAYYIKIKALASALDNLSEKEIVDLIDDFGKKQFGEYKTKYFDYLSRKLISIVVELNKRG